MTPIHRRGRLTAIKAEATPGTPEALTSAEGTAIVQDTQIKDTTTTTAQPTEGSLTYHKSVVEARSADVSTSLLFRGSGTAGVAPPWAALLKASGLAETVVADTSVAYSPVLGSTNTASLGLYQGGRGASGRVKKAAGCMFNLVVTLETGKAPMFAYTGKGTYQGMSTGTNISPTHVTTIPPKFMGATLTLDGASVKVSRVVLDFKNSVELREDETSSTGYSTAWIGDTMPTVTMDPEADTATDFHDRFQDATVGTLNCVVGATAGNILTVNMTALQLTEAPGDEDRKGMEIDTLTGIATGTSLFTITLT